MFVVLVGSVLTTGFAVASPSVFAWLITAWLWFTVLFANLAESVAEGRGKAQASSLRQARTGTTAHVLRDYSAHIDPGAQVAATTEVPSSDLTLGDVVVITVVIYLLALRRRTGHTLAELILVGSGIVAFAVSDIEYAYLNLIGAYFPGDVLHLHMEMRMRRHNGRVAHNDV